MDWYIDRRPIMKIEVNTTPFLFEVYTILYGRGKDFEKIRELKKIITKEGLYKSGAEHNSQGKR